MRSSCVRVYGFLSMLALSGVACTPSLVPPRVSSPFTDAHAASFDDGVDFIAEPSRLEGRWGADWTRDLEIRVRDADFIARVEINTLRTDVDPSQQTTLRLVAEIQELYKGRPPADGVTVSTHQGTRGYEGVDQNQSRILEREHLLYVKWYATDYGGIAAHWHLAPAADEVIRQTREFIRRDRAAQPE